MVGPLVVVGSHPGLANNRCALRQTRILRSSILCSGGVGGKRNAPAPVPRRRGSPRVLLLAMTLTPLPWLHCVAHVTVHVAFRGVGLQRGFPIQRHSQSNPYLVVLVRLVRCSRWLCPRKPRHETGSLSWPQSWLPSPRGIAIMTLGRLASTPGMLIANHNRQVSSMGPLAPSPPG